MGRKKKFTCGSIGTAIIFVVLCLSVFASRNEKVIPTATIDSITLNDRSSNALSNENILKIEPSLTNTVEFSSKTPTIFFSATVLVSSKTAQATATLRPSPVPTKSPVVIPATAIIYPTKPPANCSPSYPTVCIPPPPPDLNCKDVPFKRFKVLPPDPHNFDGDNDGIGCE